MSEQIPYPLAVIDSAWDESFAKWERAYGSLETVFAADRKRKKETPRLRVIRATVELYGRRMADLEDAREILLSDGFEYPEGYEPNIA